ncbi:MAG: right-handed parallel beta-helix repeat-containing protein [Chloroflexi bacterium]|nr:right-handed parallel beta-helix repeat-containing protein [Chloroflexota bacterium]
MDGNALVAVASADELAQVIDSANGGASPIAIELRADIRLTEALPTIEADLTIQGNGHTIDGNGVSKTLVVVGDRHVSISGTQFINRNHEQITVIDSMGIVKVADCVFDCRSDGSRGSVSIFNHHGRPLTRERHAGEMSLSNCTFLGNSADALGCRIDNFASMNISRCFFESNSVSRNVIFNIGDLTATHCSFVNNTGAGAGVAITNEGNVNLSDCVLANNVATEWFGGALFNDKGDMRLNRCSLLGNRASGGGAILNRMGELTLENCTLMGNSGELAGGAIRSGNGYLSLSNCTIAGNRAEKGAGLLADGGDVRLTHVTMVNNSAEIGGGVYALDEGYKDGIGLRNSIIAGNQGGDYVGCLDYSVGNLIGDGSCDRSLSGDPMLGELVEPEDGSPAYYPPLPDSPVINAAHRHFCTKYDQIGTYRPYKSFAGDIGAIEYVFDA